MKWSSIFFHSSLEDIWFDSFEKEIVRLIGQLPVNYFREYISYNPNIKPEKFAFEYAKGYTS